MIEIDEKEMVDRVKKYSGIVHAVIKSKKLNKNNYRSIDYDDLYQVGIISLFSRRTVPDERCAFYVIYYGIINEIRRMRLGKTNWERYSQTNYEDIEEKDDEYLIYDDTPSLFDKIEFEEIINFLSDEYKKIVQLRIIKNLTFADIGKIMNKPKSTTIKRWHKICEDIIDRYFFSGGCLDENRTEFV